MLPITILYTPPCVTPCKYQTHPRELKIPLLPLEESINPNPLPTFANPPINPFPNQPLTLLSVRVMIVEPIHVKSLRLYRALLYAIKKHPSTHGQKHGATLIKIKNSLRT